MVFWNFSLFLSEDVRTFFKCFLLGVSEDESVEEADEGEVLQRVPGVTDVFSLKQQNVELKPDWTTALRSRFAVTCRENVKRNISRPRSRFLFTLSVANSPQYICIQT